MLRSTRLSDEHGLIVLVPLVVIAVLVLVLVVGGKILYPEPPVYLKEPAPERYFAHSTVVIRQHGRVVRTLVPGDSVWLVKLESGIHVAFSEPPRTRPVGIADGLLLRQRVTRLGGTPPSPPLDSAGRPRRRA